MIGNVLTEHKCQLAVKRNAEGKTGILIASIVAIASVRGISRHSSKKKEGGFAFWKAPEHTRGGSIEWVRVILQVIEFNFDRI